MREIVMDTETTGFDPLKGDRLIEIGCVEIFNRVPTGEEYHCFINPLRDVPAAAQAVHGISTEFLQDKPVFENVADAFLNFIGPDPLVIHNAPFDIGFLNAELTKSGRQALSNDRVIDTLVMARRKHPGGSNTLDALCKRYGVDNSKRDKHGALIDSLLLAEVYLELLGERQTDFLSAGASQASARADRSRTKTKARQRPTPLPSRLSKADQDNHQAFVKTLGDDAMWWRYLAKPEEEASQD
ncbi:MAG: DNA polymerase III subunit epsilon [Pseudomonadota bacterium]